MYSGLTYLILLLFWLPFTAAAHPVSARNAFAQKAPALDTSSFVYSKFGKIAVYMPKEKPSAVVLFVSGDGGWNSGVVDMGKCLAEEGAMVLGIDARHYTYYLNRRTDKCLYPAADFEELSIFVQKKYKLATYHKPVLAGYSFGAVLIYGILAQAPASTFQGAIALGFCPDINLKKPLCEGSGLKQHVLKPNVSYYLERSEKLSAPFIVLNGVGDLTCPFAATEAFLKDMPGAELIRLDQVGHGFKVQKNWMPKFREAFRKVAQASAFVQMQPLPGDMSLSVVPASRKSDNPLIFMISGDGGWTSFDQDLAEALAKKNLGVIGLDAQKYFWNARTPEQTALDAEKVIAHYLEQYQKTNFILAGYSFGASIVPFIASRLSTKMRSQLKGVVSLSPDISADFEIHISDMLGIGNNERYNVIREMQKIRSCNPVCCFGSEEEQEITEKFKKAGIKVIILPGSHHFGNNYALIAEQVAGHLVVKP